MKNSKYPDNIVWDDDKGWIANRLPYPSSVGSPPIEPPNITKWKETNLHKVNGELKQRWLELEQEFKQFHTLYQTNQFIYSECEINFEPQIGHHYWVWRREDGTHFLSIVDRGLNLTKIGEFLFNSNRMFEEIEK